MIVVACQLFLASVLNRRHSLKTKEGLWRILLIFLSLNRIEIKHTANLTTKIGMSLYAVCPESKHEINRHEERYTAEAAYMHTATLCFPVHLGFSLLLLSSEVFCPREHNKIIDHKF